MKVVLEARNIKKSFGGIQALKGVSIKLYEHETLALLGDNGAGKSTLIKIISGVYKPDEGEIFIDGKKVEFKDPRDARKLGIETVYQELSLLDQQDVVTNVFLGREMLKFKLAYIFNILNTKVMEKRTKKLLDEMGIKTISNLRKEVKLLSGGQRQAVALARARLSKPRILILDEPTAALGVKETRMILELIKKFKEEGVPMILISHSLPIVFEIADRIVILREGKVVAEERVEETNEKEVVSFMVGVEG
ncbi:MAG: sugar ABC transporter ATP-binding protein [Thermotogaceae bacterium]|nr:sugar ABC transporter ATP-binding protein [Thermotogaceae bacterium]